MNLFEKFSAEFLRFSKTTFFRVRNKFIGFSLSIENFDNKFNKAIRINIEINKYPNKINNWYIFNFVDFIESFNRIEITFTQLI